MKKVFDQTVRDLKREVNKKVLKVPGIEQKILDATSNEPWGPHGALLADLAQSSRNYQDYKMIMNVVWKRINDTGKNWRHVYKALAVLEYLVAHGPERVIDEIREHAHQISTLSNFQYIDSGGKDQGGNVRRKSQSLVALVNDKDKIQEARQKASSNRDKYRNTVSTSTACRSSYGDRYDDDHPEGRYDDRNDNGQDGEEHYGKDRYRDDDNRGRVTDGSRKSADRYTDRSVDDDDDDCYSSKSGGGRGEDHPHGDRQLEHPVSEQSVGLPPSYEEATRDAQNHSHNERDGEAVASAADRSSSQAAPEATSPTKTTNPGPDHVAPAEAPGNHNKEINAFDEFDPRGSVSAGPHSSSSADFDFFGLSASDSTNLVGLIQVSSEADMPTNSGFGMDFVASSAASKVSNQDDGNPFGDSPFRATVMENEKAQPQNFAPVSSIQPSEPFSSGIPNSEMAPTFEFGDMLGGLNYTHIASGQLSFASSSTEISQAPASSDVLDGILPWTGPTTFTSSQTAQPEVPRHVQAAPMNPVQESGFASKFLPQADQVSSQAGQSAAPNDMQSTHLDFPQQGVAPVSSQAQQPEAPNNVQPAHSNFPQQHESVSAVLPAQGYPSSQAAGSATDNNMQLAPLNFFQQPEMFPSASLPSLETQSSLHAAQPVAPNNTHVDLFNNFQQPGLSAQAAPSSLEPTFSSPAAQPVGPGNIHSPHLSSQGQPGVSTRLAPQAAPVTSFGPPAITQPRKFEPKSKVWADTLNKGLVDLNISGAKVNPLSDIGIDFDSINRMEKRKEPKRCAAPVTSTNTMGKAMGAGSGISRASGGFSPPPNPMMGSTMVIGGGRMGMGGGAGVGMGAGMSGYGRGMNQPLMDMGMAMGHGAQMWPPTGMPPPGPGMPGVGYNPTTGMGNYGTQQPYGSGPTQQQFGGGYR